VTIASKRFSPASTPSPKRHAERCRDHGRAAMRTGHRPPRRRHRRSVCPSVRYRTTGATEPSRGFALVASANAAANSRLPRRARPAGVRVGVFEHAGGSTRRAWISGSGRGPSGGVSSGRRRWNTLRGNSKLKTSPRTSRTASPPAAHSRPVARLGHEDVYGYDDIQLAIASRIR